MLKVVKQKTAM